jgi:membrane protease YdiL (CAAX protease family)
MNSSLSAVATSDAPVVPPSAAVTPLRMWLALVGLGVLGVFGATPFFLPVLAKVLSGHKAPLPVGVLLLLQDVQALVLLVAPAVALGVWAAPRVGLDAPLLRARLAGERVGKRLLQLLPLAVLAGTVGAASTLVLSLAMKSRLPAGVGDFPPLPPWVSATSALYGGIVEELLTRWGLLSFFALAFARLGLSPTRGFWAANVASALGFGLLHLPGARALHMPLTPLVVGYLVVGNSLVGLLCGWLFRRRGLESAMLAHGSADLWLHTVFPLFGL